jgi:hypothetical protein
MSNALPSPDPIAIALETMTTGETVVFKGIDLESGATVTVAINQLAPSAPKLTPTLQSAVGLVLTISLERFAEPN